MMCSTKNCDGVLVSHAVWGNAGHRDGLRCPKCGAEYEADGSAYVAATESSEPLPSEAAAAVDDSGAEEPTPAPDASESPAPEKSKRGGRR